MSPPPESPVFEALHDAVVWLEAEADHPRERPAMAMRLLAKRLRDALGEARPFDHVDYLLNGTGEAPTPPLKTQIPGIDTRGATPEAPAPPDPRICPKCGHSRSVHNDWGCDSSPACECLAGTADSPDLLAALVSALDFIADWAHDCWDPHDAASATYGFLDIEQLARKAIRGAVSPVPGGEPR